MERSRQQKVEVSRKFPRLSLRKSKQEEKRGTEGGRDRDLFIPWFNDLANRSYFAAYLETMKLKYD